MIYRARVHQVLTERRGWYYSTTQKAQYTQSVANPMTGLVIRKQYTAAKRANSPFVHTYEQEGWNVPVQTHTHQFVIGQAS